MIHDMKKTFSNSNNLKKIRHNIQQIIQYINGKSDQRENNSDIDRNWIKNVTSCTGKLNLKITVFN